MSVISASKVWTNFQPLSKQTLFGVVGRSYSMLAWKLEQSISSSDGVSIKDKLALVETSRPSISTPWDVLVKTHSTSINPIDVRMCHGYGRRILDLLDMATNFETRITNDRYPLTLGRDFSGEVVASGPCAKFKQGDLVFGAVEPQRSGAHAQFVSVPSYCLTKKPDNISHNEAASIPFVALTAHAALSTFGCLNRNNAHGKQVLIIGGSGGVGSFAIQLLKLWGAHVVATCSDSKIAWLEDTLFVDEAICHNDPTQMDSLVGRFDFVLDCGNYERQALSHQEIIENSLKYLKPYNQGTYVTLSPPILANTDESGLVLGSAKTMLQVACDTISGLRNLNSARWAVFLPNKQALDYVSNLLGDEAIKPMVSSVFNFNEIIKAYEALGDGSTRGKVVVDVTKFGTSKPNDRPGHNHETATTAENETDWKSATH